MPLYSLDIEKQLGTEYWTNRYILDGASPAGLNTAAVAIVAAERAITLDSVTFTKYRISSVATGDDDYVIIALGSAGQRAVGGATALPLFNCVRVDFDATQGRPSRKYLRGIIAEGDQSDFGVLNDTLLDFVDENYTGYVVGVPEFVDVDGQGFTGGRSMKAIAMRQLRRGSRRRTTPIL